MSKRVPLLESLFTQYGVREVDKGQIRASLALLKNKDLQTYMHSLRTTLLAMEIATFFGADPKPLLFAGPRHDLGKLEVPDRVLKKISEFTEEDYAKMRPHPVNTFRRIEPQSAFSAHISVRHHRHSKDPYPKVLPKGINKMSRKAKLLANKYSKFLAIADFWDAATNRKNSRSSPKNNSLGNLRKLMLEERPKLKPMIIKLFDAGFFDSHFRSVQQRNNTLWKVYSRRAQRNSRRIAAAGFAPRGKRLRA